MYTEIIQDFTGVKTIAVDNKVRKIELYNSAGDSLIDNCNALITFGSSGNAIVLQRSNFLTTDFPLKLVAVDGSDASSAITLFDLYTTSNAPGEYNIAIGKKGELCRCVMISDLYQYMASNLDYLSENPRNWNLNQSVAQESLDVYSRDEFLAIDRTGVHVSIDDDHYGSVSGLDLATYYTCSGIITLSGYRINELTQYYNVTLNNFDWVGLGRGEYLKVTSLAGPQFDFLMKPLDVPVIMTAAYAKTIDGSLNGWCPPTVVITPYNRSFTIAGNTLDANSLYVLVFDYYSGSGVPHISGNFKYFARTGAIGNIQ